MKQTIAAIGIAFLFMCLAAASSLLRLSGLSFLWTAMGAGAFVAVLLFGSQRNKGGLR